MTAVRRLCGLLAAVVAVALAGSTPALAQDDEDRGKRPPPVNPVQRAAALARPGVVYVGIHWRARVLNRTSNQYFNNGQPIEVTAACSGFAVNPDGHVATAGHCVDEGINGAMRLFARRVVVASVREGTVPPEQASRL